MKHHLLLAVALVAPWAHATAVEYPPVPRHEIPPQEGWFKGGTRMPSYVLQVSTGPVECPARWYQPTACRPYIPGRDKRMRAFVRKQGGAWEVCPRPSGRDGCVGIRDLPNMVEQE